MGEIGYRRTLLAAAVLIAGLATLGGSGAQPVRGVDLPTVRQQAQLERMKRSDPSARVRWNKETGTPASIVGRLSGPLAGPADQVAARFLQANAQLFQMQNAAAEFKMLRVKRGAGGWQHVKMQQMHQSVPVEARQMYVHINDANEVRAVNGHYVPGIRVNTTPRILGPAAAAVAARDLTRGAGGPRQTSPEQLVVYPYKNGHYLAWKVRHFVDNPVAEYITFVDAQTGRVIHRYNDLKTVRNRNTHDAANDCARTRLPGALVRNEGSATSGDAVLDAAHDNAGTTYDLYMNSFGRDSFDNAGAAITSSVRFCTKYSNAFWSLTLQQMVYGDGDGVDFGPFSQSLDVVAHELTHAVTDAESNLVYENQSGAINESLSDIFGALVDPDWMIGEDVYTPAIAGDALRRLDDPPKGGSPQPDHREDMLETESDNGGVHTNSGIPNKAAFLMSDGGAHRCTFVRGMGRNDMGRVFYEAQINWLTENSDFEDLRDATASAAGVVFPGDGPRLATVNTAWDAVGVRYFDRLGTASAGAISALSQVSIASNRAVTAMRNGNGNLQLIAWDVSSGGAVTRLGTATAGTISAVRLSALGATRVVTGLRNGSGDLQLITWDVSGTGAIVRRGSATAGAVGLVDILALGPNRIVAAMRNGSGNLQLIAWDVSASGEMTRRGSATAGAISALRVSSLGPNRVMVVMRNGSNNLQLTAWDVTEAGEFTRRGTATAGTVSAVALAVLRPERVVAAMRNGSDNLQLISFDVSPAGDIARRASATAGEITQVAVVSARNDRVVTVMRDGSENLRLIAWGVAANGDILRCGMASAGEISLTDVASLSDSRLVTAMRDGSDNLRLIAWDFAPPTRRPTRPFPSPANVPVAPPVER